MLHLVACLNQAHQEQPQTSDHKGKQLLFWQQCKSVVHLSQHTISGRPGNRNPAPHHQAAVGQLETHLLSVDGTQQAALLLLVQTKLDGLNGPLLSMLQ
jgi:hypothetical protein